MSSIPSVVGVNPAFDTLGDITSYGPTMASATASAYNTVAPVGNGGEIPANFGYEDPISYKVIITGGGNLVRFEASAPISESRIANYEGFNIVHLPTSLWSYRNTNGRHFSITGKLISRNIGEAKANARYLTTVRSWILPNFGSSGSPPPILFLTAYSNKQINKVPCVLLSYNWQFPEEVDYIFGAPEPMPVIGIITLELEEVYSAKQITAGEWAINTDTQAEGEFSYGGTKGSAGPGELSPDSAGGPGAIEFAGIAGSPFPKFPTVGGMLSLSPGAIAKLPTMLGSIVGAATNSPLLSTVTQEAVGLLNNRFVSGSSVQGILGNSNSSPRVDAAIPAQPPLDPFNQASTLSPPNTETWT